MRAVKGNREYTIYETQKKGYQDSGFDILGDDDNVIAYGRGKTITYDVHMRAVKEIERLQELVSERYTEIEALKAEISDLKAGKQETAKKETAKKTEAEKAGE